MPGLINSWKTLEYATLHWVTNNQLVIQIYAVLQIEVALARSQGVAFYPNATAVKRFIQLISSTINDNVLSINKHLDQCEIKQQKHGWLVTRRVEEKISFLSTKGQERNEEGKGKQTSDAPLYEQEHNERHVARVAMTGTWTRDRGGDGWRHSRSGYEKDDAEGECLSLMRVAIVEYRIKVN